MLKIQQAMVVGLFSPQFNLLVSILPPSSLILIFFFSANYLYTLIISLAALSPELHNQLFNTATWFFIDT